MQYKWGGGGFGELGFLGVGRVWTVWGWCSVGVLVLRCVSKCRSKSVSVWRHLSPIRKMDSISKGDPF